MESTDIFGSQLLKQNRQYSWSDRYFYIKDNYLNQKNEINSDDVKFSIKLSLISKVEVESDNRYLLVSFSDEESEEADTIRLFSNDRNLIHSWVSKLEELLKADGSNPKRSKGSRSQSTRSDLNPLYFFGQKKRDNHKMKNDVQRKLHELQLTMEKEKQEYDQIIQQDKNSEENNYNNHFEDINIGFNNDDNQSSDSDQEGKDNQFKNKSSDSLNKLKSLKGTSIKQFKVDDMKDSKLKSNTINNKNEEIDKIEKEKTMKQNDKYIDDFNDKINLKSCDNKIKTKSSSFVENNVKNSISSNKDIYKNEKRSSESLAKSSSNIELGMFNSIFNNQEILTNSPNNKRQNQDRHSSPYNNQENKDKNLQIIDESSNIKNEQSNIKKISSRPSSSNSSESSENLSKNKINRRETEDSMVSEVNTDIKSTYKSQQTQFQVSLLLNNFDSLITEEEICKEDQELISRLRIFFDDLQKSMYHSKISTSISKINIMKYIGKCESFQQQKMILIKIKIIMVEFLEWLDESASDQSEIQERFLHELIIFVLKKFCFVVNTKNEYYLSYKLFEFIIYDIFLTQCKLSNNLSYGDDDQQYNIMQDTNETNGGKVIQESIAICKKLIFNYIEYSYEMVLGEFKEFIMNMFDLDEKSKIGFEALNLYIEKSNILFDYKFKFKGDHKSSEIIRKQSVYLNHTKFFNFYSKQQDELQNIIKIRKLRDNIINILILMIKNYIFPFYRTLDDILNDLTSIVKSKNKKDHSIQNKLFNFHTMTDSPSRTEIKEYDKMSMLLTTAYVKLNDVQLIYEQINTLYKSSDHYNIESLKIILDHAEQNQKMYSEQLGTIIWMYYFKNDKDFNKNLLSKLFTSIHLESALLNKNMQQISSKFKEYSFHLNITCSLIVLKSIIVNFVTTQTKQLFASNLNQQSLQQQILEDSSQIQQHLINLLQNELDMVQSEIFIWMTPFSIISKSLDQPDSDSLQHLLKELQSEGNEFTADFVRDLFDYFNYEDKEYKRSLLVEFIKNHSSEQ